MSDNNSDSEEAQDMADNNSDSDGLHPSDADWSQSQEDHH